MILPDLGYAVEVHCSPSNPEDCIAVMRSGDKAPFPGHLLPNHRAAKLLTDLDQCKTQISLDAEKCATMKILDERVLVRLAASDAKAWGAKEDLYKREIARITAERDSLWRSRWIAGLGGVVLGGLACGWLYGALSGY